MQEAQIIDFLKKAKTRGGVAWKVEFIHKDAGGEISHLAGHVEEFENNEVKTIPMVWNIRGGAIYHVLLRYDLIEELPIHYGEQLQEAEHEPLEGGGGNPQN